MHDAYPEDYIREPEGGDKPAEPKFGQTGSSLAQAIAITNHPMFFAFRKRSTSARPQPNSSLSYQHMLARTVEAAVMMLCLLLLWLLVLLELGLSGLLCC